MKKISLRRYMYFHFLMLVFVLLLLFLMLFGVYPAKIADSYRPTNQYQETLLLLSCVVVFFVIISGLFFYHLHKRLLPLQKAIETSIENASLPEKIPSPKGKVDEIARLELAFNQMAHQLKESYLREKKEEELRKKLITAISHDIRTPLTVLRGQTAQLQKEQLSKNGFVSLQSLNQTISYIGDLVDNLLAYTLLNSEKYPYHSQQVNIVRLVRTSIASWYPIFEQKNFQIVIDLPENHSFSWKIDPQWFERVLNNIFQNVIRHANNGKYIIIRLDSDLELLTIKDHGNGLTNSSDSQGMGIGLKVSRRMLKQMSLEVKFDSSPQGTTVQIFKN